MGVAYPVLTGAEVLVEINKVLTNTTNKITDARALALDNLDTAVSGAVGSPAFRWSLIEVDNFRTVAGTWAVAAFADNHEKVSMRNQAAAAVNDAICLGHIVVPATGTYTAYLQCTKGSGQGNVHFMLNNVDKGSINCYNGSAIYNQMDSVDLGSLTKGVYPVVLKLASKDASSSGYVCDFTTVSIMKT